MIKGYRYKILPNKTQEQQLNQMLGNARFVYNWALKTRIEAYQKDKTKVSAFTLMTELTKLKKQPEYDWLNLSVAQSLQQSIVNMEKAFNSSPSKCSFDLISKVSISNTQISLCFFIAFKISL